MLRRLLIILILLLAVFVSGAQETIEKTTCFEEPYGFVTACGYVTLPADYDNPDDSTVEIYYSQILSNSDTPAPDPLVYLVGGPGSSGSQLLQSSFRLYLRPFALDRDIVIIDQRGTGLSNPTLYCRETLQRLDDILQSTWDTHAETVLDVLTDCHTRLNGRDIRLDTFNSQNNARDIVNVMLSLGYDEWNLVGVSYGSRLALTMMRDYPQHLRSVILDSVYPLEADLYIDAYYHGQRALDELFAACADDVLCNSSYPDLEAVFYRLYDDLNESPITVHYRPPRYHTLTIQVSGYRLYDWIFSWLYSINSIESIPKMIYALAEGDTEAVVRMGTLYESSLTGISLGMHYSVQCQEEFISDDNRDYSRIIETFPHLSGYLRYPVEGITTVERLCDLWQAAPRDDIANMPVSSDVPTLLLTGIFDPITPPDYANLVDVMLESSYNFVLPHVSHGVLRSDNCAVEIALAFVASPDAEPDSSCIDEIQPMIFD